jgi:hypothetical protein
MATFAPLLAATALGLAALLTPAAAAAAPAASACREGDEAAWKSLRTNMALLAALVERRAALETNSSGNRDEALAFLDRRIAEVRGDVLEARDRLRK